VELLGEGHERCVDSDSGDRCVVFLNGRGNFYGSGVGLELKFLTEGTLERVV